MWYLIARKKVKEAKLHLFVNVLFFLLIAGELVMSIPKYQNSTKVFHSTNLIQSFQAEKPSIYIVLLDEYPRQDVLRSLFGFDNAGFLNLLRDRGFAIDTQSRSNYDLSFIPLMKARN